jgi:hypothetical protein
MQTKEFYVPHLGIVIDCKKCFRAQVSMECNYGTHLLGAHPLGTHPLDALGHIVGSTKCTSTHLETLLDTLDALGHTF